MSHVTTIEKLLVEELNDIYSAESQITKSLPTMAKAATEEELRTAFEHHLRETQSQVKRLDKVFEILGVSPKGKTCHGMKGILDECEEVLSETEKGDVCDAALISAAQRVEHYEIAAYGSVRTYAQQLGNEQVASLLQETLEEEKAADKKLTGISSKIYQYALHAA